MIKWIIKIMIHCRSGKRANDARIILTDAGYTAQHYPCYWDHWKELFSIASGPNPELKSYGSYHIDPILWRITICVFEDENYIRRDVCCKQFNIYAYCSLRLILFR